MVAMILINPQQLYLGNDRYSMPIHLTSNNVLLDALEKLGIEHSERIKDIDRRHTFNRNPQKLHRSFKEEMMAIIRAHLKKVMPKIIKKIDALKEDKKSVLNNLTMEEEKCTEAAFLDDQIKKLEMIKFVKARDTVATSYMIYREMLTKP